MELDKTCFQYDMVNGDFARDKSASSICINNKNMLNQELDQ